ncbi:NF038104 family lipoprotein [Neisseria perflava]|uniref:NF038104 family lipoprotein n=1 Tax=Neisseria perflava TaxID=33053 RepID=UPI0020A1AAAB|nr:NF038104 family lipoprotein [Neisseria perflava]MCP1660789.1 hypothetical protein [Neisseria perflava]MCP1773304.1 hypothetical protein [Neisseria perflava]
MKIQHLILPLMMCISLSGCVVAAVADLAATTVVTAGKVAVKGTGALVRAAIPDGDDDEKKDKKKKRKDKQEGNTAQSSAVATPVQQQYPYAATPTSTQDTSAAAYGTDSSQSVSYPVYQQY